jgi:hypothetical protein
MAFNTNPYTFSIRDIQVRRAGTTVQFPAAQQMSITPMVVSGILRGSSAIRSANSYIEGAEGTLGIGGIPLSALPVMIGATAGSVTGSTPNQVQQIAINASAALPYFEIIGRAEQGDGGDVHVWVPQAKVMSNFTITVQDGANFAAPEMSFTCVPDSANAPFYFIAHETTTAIAFPALTVATLTDIDVADNLATATSDAAHGFSAGQLITVAGADASYVNGLKQVITAPTTTTFTFVAIGADVTNQTGTATAGTPA